MNVSIEKFKKDLEKQFKHKKGKKIVVSTWGTIPKKDAFDDEIINIGLARFSDLSEEEIQLLPSEIDGVKCVYHYAGEITVLSPEVIDVENRYRLDDMEDPEVEYGSTTDKYDPLIGGISWGAIDITAGTLAGVVWGIDTGVPFLLTNEHIVSNTQNSDPNHPPKGHPIVQPGPIDGGSYPDDVAGYLDRVGGMKAATLNGEPCNIDAALVIAERSFIQNNFWSIGTIPLHPHVEASIGDDVVKVGRTSGITDDVVTEVGISANVGGIAWGDYAHMVDLISTSSGNFAHGGDSGSRVFKSDTMEPIGLIFASGASQTLVIRAQNIVDKFGVSFAELGPPGIEITIGDKFLVTDGSGRASTNLKAGMYNSLINYSDYITKGETVSIDYKDKYINTTLLRNRHDITFTVLHDATSEPIIGVVVDFWQHTGTTDENGSITFEDIPWGNYSWSAHKDFYYGQTGSIDFAEETTIELSLTGFGIITSLDDYIDLGTVDPIITVVLEGSTFKDDGSEVDPNNWYITLGTTSVTLDYIERVSNTSVTFNFVGNLQQGYIQIGAKAGAINVTTDTNIVSIFTFLATVTFSTTYLNEPVNDTNVYLGEEHLLTDQQGIATFEEVLKGDYAWEVSRAGFLTTSGITNLSRSDMVKEYTSGGFWSNAYDFYWTDVIFLKNEIITTIAYRNRRGDRYNPWTGTREPDPRIIADWTMILKDTSDNIIREQTIYNAPHNLDEEGDTWLYFGIDPLEVFVNQKFFIEFDISRPIWHNGWNTTYEGTYWKNTETFMGSNEKLVIGFDFYKFAKVLNIPLELT